MSTPRNDTWGTDGVLSMPEAMESSDTAMVDMEGFCFTPLGLRVNITAAEREEIIASGYGPGERRG